jgi:hypothetical protein
MTADPLLPNATSYCHFWLISVISSLYVIFVSDEKLNDWMILFCSSYSKIFVIDMLNVGVCGVGVDDDVVEDDDEEEGVDGVVMII